MHGDRVVVRIERQHGGPRRRAHHPDPRARATRRSSAATTATSAAWATSCRSIAACSRTSRCRRARQAARRPGEMVIVELTRWPTPTRGRARPRRRGARRHRRARRRHRDHHPQARHPRRALATRRSPRRARLGTAVSRARHRAAAPTSATVPTVTIDGEHARDFDDAITHREAAERPLLARRAHRRRLALRARRAARSTSEAYERGTSVYFPERAVHMFPSELATGLCSLNPHVDRLVQSCLMEVDRTRRGRALRVPRRRHQQQRADDLHRGQRHPDRPRSATLIERYAPLVPMFELMRELFQILNDAAPPPRLDRLRPARGRSRSWTRPASIEAIIAPSATSRTG